MPTEIDTVTGAPDMLREHKGSRMRILHIIDTISPEAGGPTESVKVLLRYGPADYSSEVVTLDDSAADYIQSFEFTVHALGPTSTVYGHNSKLFPWLAANRDRFDGVMIHGLWGYCGYAAWRAFRGNTPYVVFTHGMLDPYFKRRFPLKHLKKWAYWLVVEYWLLRRAFRVLFTTDAEERLARQSFWLHRWNGFVVPFGTSAPPQFRAEFSEAFSERCPRVKGHRFLLFLGRIHRKKGCDMLIDAFARAAVDDPDLHLVMAGPDQQQWSAELQAIAASRGIADRVHWPGMLRSDAKWGAFYACEAFILPSHQENFGIAVAEALGCGRPVLLADKVNIAEEIAGDRAGLMETDTPEGTSRLLERWIGMTAEQRSVMGERALDCFHRRYNMQENAGKIMRIFDLAGSKRDLAEPKTTLDGSKTRPGGVGR